MALLIRLSKGTRDYICKTQRQEWWDDRIAKAEQELADIQYGDEKAVEKKKEEIKRIKEDASENMQLVEKIGPTTFQLHSVSKVDIRASMPKHLKKAALKVSEEDGITVETMDYSRDYAIHVCKKGLDGWDNLIDIDTGKEIPFDRDIIEAFPDDILGDLANEIQGVIDRDEIKNFSKQST